MKKLLFAILAMLMVVPLAAQANERTVAANLARTLEATVFSRAQSVTVIGLQQQPMTPHLLTAQVFVRNYRHVDGVSGLSAPLSSTVSGEAWVYLYQNARNGQWTIRLLTFRGVTRSFASAPIKLYASTRRPLPSPKGFSALTMTRFLGNVVLQGVNAILPTEVRVDTLRHERILTFYADQVPFNTPQAGTLTTMSSWWGSVVVSGWGKAVFVQRAGSWYLASCTYPGLVGPLTRVFNPMIRVPQKAYR